MSKRSDDIASRSMRLVDYSTIDAVAILFVAQYTLLLGLFDDRRDEVIDHMRKTIDEFEDGNGK